MKKPSMFSKDYHKEMKNRRIKILLLIIVPIIGLTIFSITDFNGLFNKGISMKKGINNVLLNKSKKDIKEKENKVAEVQKKSEQVDKTQSNSQKVKAPVKAPVKKVSEDNKVFLVSLSDGQKISIQYNVVGSEKKIKGVKGAKDISYDISPSKKSIVVQSTNNQDLLYFNVNKISKDITRKVHTSTKGQIISKENQLQRQPNYVWSITPKFIDEDNVVYVSELPWINKKAVQYIWKVNLKNNDYTQVKEAFGESVTFKNMTSKGLETLIDGDVLYINSSGEVIK